MPNESEIRWLSDLEEQDYAAAAPTHLEAVARASHSLHNEQLSDDVSRTSQLQWQSAGVYVILARRALRRQLDGFLKRQTTAFLPGTVEGHVIAQGRARWATRDGRVPMRASTSKQAVRLTSPLPARRLDLPSCDAPP